MTRRMLSALALLTCVACAEAPTATYADVEPILAENCMACHAEDGSSGVSLDGYQAAASLSDRMVARAVEEDGGAMPPSGLVLSAEQEDVLIAWEEAGAPE